MIMLPAFPCPDSLASACSRLRQAPTRLTDVFFSLHLGQQEKPSAALEERVFISGKRTAGPGDDSGA